MKRLAKQIVKENPDATLKEQALLLYNAKLFGPSLYECRKLIREARGK